MIKKTWPERVRELQASGLTYSAIAKLTDSSLSTIGSIATGQSKSPRGDLALRLHTLHKKHVKN